MHYLLLCAPLAGQALAKSVGKRDDDNSDEFYEMLNDKLAYIALLVLAALVTVTYLWKLVFAFAAHLRRLSSFNNEQQHYFVPADEALARLKRHLLYAPLFRARHNREFQLSRALNMGTLPSRLHTALLLGIVVMNVVLCLVTVPFKADEHTTAGVIRNRTGTMATVNLIPLVLLAGRNNPLIRLLHISFDTYNLLHRWLGRIVVLEATVHAFAWIIPKAQQDGWSAVGMKFAHDDFYSAGLTAAIAFAVLVLHSVSPIRHAFYETFLHLHIVVVVIAMLFLWMHLDGYVAQSYLLVAVAIWSIERFTRFATLVYRNVARRPTVALVETVPGDAMRITIQVARPWKFQPGQHVYLYIPAVGWWTSHPFSVAWSETGEVSCIQEKGSIIPMTRQDVQASQQQQQETVSLLVRRRTGFTNKLFERARDAAGSRVSLRAVVVGPYGSIHSLDSYGTCLLFAGGVGVTHHVPFVRHLVKGYADGTAAVRRLTLVWIIQSPEHLEWIRPWMNSILSMPRRREVLRVMLFITRSRDVKDLQSQSQSTTVQMFAGRPNIAALVESETDTQVGAMGVMVCGNGALSDDVRRACRRTQDRTTVDFIEESFSW